MTPQLIEIENIHKELKKQARLMALPENHLKHLVAEPDRLEQFSVDAASLFYDFSRHRVTPTVMGLLKELAVQCQLQLKFTKMISGENVNRTEDRAALHTASRQFSDDPVYVDGQDVFPDILEQRRQMRAFSDQVRSGRICGATDKPFEHIVVVGIGGSYLGTEFVSTALSAYADSRFKLHYLANVDIHNFGHVVRNINAETTLWVVVSKSYTTTETLANANIAKKYVEEQGLDPKRHFVAVTAKGSPGDDANAEILKSFHMYDFIGGRYSVTSAVGGVPLSLYLGYDKFERFLKGAEDMDIHAQTAPVDRNGPLIAALISVWNNNFLGYSAQGIIPYATPLAKLAPHIQQLNMESNGKSVTAEGEYLSSDTGPIIFGEPGTNAQHSFFQLAHQGRPFPIDFIGVVHPHYTQYTTTYKSVTNHQELWANLISQPRALAIGKEDADAARSFSGNRPSATLVIKNLSPENVGRLLAFYEARTVFEAFVWGINPFDQFGVELGKTMASDVRAEMAIKNDNLQYNFNKSDPISSYYLNMLFEK